VIVHTLLFEDISFYFLDSHYSWDYLFYLYLFILTNKYLDAYISIHFLKAGVHSHQPVEVTVKRAKPAICHTRQHMCEHKFIFCALSLSLQFRLTKHFLPLFLGLLCIIICSFLSENSDLETSTYRWYGGGHHFLTNPNMLL
jgi:hypothetical protein